VEAKKKFATPVELDIDLGGLANDAAMQTELKDIAADGFEVAKIAVSIKLGASPSGDTSVNIYLLTGDGVIRTDGATVGKGSFTANLKNASLLIPLSTGDSPVTGDVLEEVITVYVPGPEIGVVVENKSGVALDADNNNHKIQFTGVTTDIS
jgi:citrate lyase alpha subunit